MSSQTREDPRHKQERPPFPAQKQRPTGSEQAMQPRPDFGQSSYRGSGRLAKPLP